MSNFFSLFFAGSASFVAIATIIFIAYRIKRREEIPVDVTLMGFSCFFVMGSIALGFYGITYLTAIFASFGLFLTVLCAVGFFKRILE